MNTAVVAKKGQVTIPKVIRDHLDIIPSTVLEFSVQDSLIIIKKQPATNPVDNVLGCLKIDKSSDDIVDELRGKA